MSRRRPPLSDRSAEHPCRGAGAAFSQTGSRVYLATRRPSNPTATLEPSTFRLRVEDPSSSTYRPGLFWLLTSVRLSIECVPDLSCYGRGNDQGNDQDGNRVDCQEKARLPCSVGLAGLEPATWRL
jgi:hypothetical protein